MAAKPAPIPAGLRLALELTTPIQTDTAAAGDPFTAKLVKPLRDARQKLLAPAGSIVEGRLLRVQSFRFPRREALIVLKPESVEIHHAKAPLSAVRDWTLASPAIGNNKQKGLKIVLPPPGGEHAAVFLFDGEHVTVKRGFRSDWRTLVAQ